MTRPIAPEDLFRLRFVVAADLSPDGSQVVFAQTRIGPGETADEAEEPEEVEHTDLHLLEVESGEIRRLTYSDSTNSAPAISPDGSQVAFTSSRTEKPQLWLLPVDGGEPRRVTDLPQGVGGGAVWSPDGSKLAFTAGPQEDPRKPERPYRVTRTVWRFDEIGILDDAVQDVYVLDLDGDAEPRRLTDDRFMNSQPRWSADEKSLVYVASHDPDSYELMSRLRRVDLDGAVTDLTEADGLVASHGTMSDGRVAYVLDFERDQPVGSRASLYVLDPATGARTRRGADIEGHIEGGLQPDNPGSRLGLGQLLFSEGDRDALVRVQTRGDVALVRVALEGGESHTVLAGGTRACSPIAVRGSKVLFGAFGFTEPGDLYLVDLDTGEERRLTRLNEDVLEELDLPAVVPLSFSGIDGTGVEGWFLRQAGAEAPLPTVLSIHGGPHGAWGAQFSFDHLMFAGAGYGVLLVNHRASTGYGDAFATAIERDWGNLDYADLMSGVDHAVEEGLADPDRLGVFGISGGGNLTGWVIGHTDRFKAACPENPVFNWFSMYGTSDVGADFSVRELGGTPSDAEEVYRRCSPITYAHRCTTPTLFLQHECDYRCPAEQTEQFFTVLRVNGVPAEMLRFPNTSHAGSVRGPIGHRRAQNEALLDWMNRYVLGAAPEASEKEAVAAPA
ncbi:MAG TPA: S9 family peptidase [Gaiellaceae bacterium]|nr:S9 family peptidase [Gaiellaceae bacterium]